MKNKICATIVLYNPDENTFDNIASYVNSVSTLIVIDNSDVHNPQLIQQLLNAYQNIEYINNGENLGIATALNIACDRAIELKFPWILTMDQDSRFIDFQSFASCSTNIINTKQNIGIIAPNHTGNKKHILNKKDCSFIEKEFLITSGNILNLHYFNKIGRFDDKLFIDMVDYDYSNKCILNNLKILLLPNHYIIHSIGEVFQRKNIITRKIRFKTEHNPQRVYYMTRNRLYLSKKYSKSFQKEYNYLKTINILFVHDITKIILYEADKLMKLKAKAIGLYHFIFSKYGKFNFK